MIRFDSVEQLTRRDSIERLLGPVSHLAREPLGGASSFSGARHERLRIDLADGTSRTLVLKLARPALNWIAVRTGDTRGREAALLAEPSLAGVWDVFEPIYLAFAEAGGEIGLLMVDLAPHLTPDVREPVSERHEEALLSTLARLHARYWESPVLDHPWLGSTSALARLLAPSMLDDPGQSEGVPPPLRERVLEGWALARERLPERLWTLLRAPLAEQERLWSGLPHTLIHGDAKVANLVLLPNGRLAAFDWEVVSAAPVTTELCWYLIVNATRLARPRDAVVALYRSHLERQLGRGIADGDWDRMLDAGSLAASLMLLWSKAMALREGRPGSQAEWNWWVERLEGAAAR